MINDALPQAFLVSAKGSPMNTSIKTIGRDEYIASIGAIEDFESCRFADQALAWWDRHFSWNAQGCDVLVGEADEHLCYMFSKIDRYSEYLTVYNLFTPLHLQRQGYAHELLRLIILRAVEKHVRRITFTSVSASLDFYLSLGFIYWGINVIGDYYCNLPIPANGLDGIDRITSESAIETLLGRNRDKIYAKVHGNNEDLTPLQSLRYEADQIKMGNSCKLNELEALIEQG